MRPALKKLCKEKSTQKGQSINSIHRTSKRAVKPKRKKKRERKRERKFILSTRNRRICLECVPLSLPLTAICAKDIIFSTIVWTMYKIRNLFVLCVSRKIYAQCYILFYVWYGCVYAHRIQVEWNVRFWSYTKVYMAFNGFRYRLEQSIFGKIFQTP